MCVKQIEWTSLDADLPDDGMLVLMAFKGNPEPNLGYREGDQWIYADGMPCDDEPDYWCELPEVPECGSEHHA